VGVPVTLMNCHADEPALAGRHELDPEGHRGHVHVDVVRAAVLRALSALPDPFTMATGVLRSAVGFALTGVFDKARVGTGHRHAPPVEGGTPGAAAGRPGSYGS